MGGGGGKGGGKGKGGQEYYEYFGNFAMGLCEGPVSEVLRIWADSNLIYDKYNVDDEDVVDIGFSTDQGDSGGGKGGGKGGGGKGKGGGKGQGAGTKPFQFEFYNGAESQVPPDFMVEKNGEDRPTPGHRGLCFLFFRKFPLKDFGNRIPTITAEVIMPPPERKPSWTWFDQLDPPWTTGVVGTLYLDPLRRKFYLHAGDANNVGIMRHFDIGSRKEVSRIPYIKTTANVPHVPNPITQDPSLAKTKMTFSHGQIIGVAASGNLVSMSMNAQNAAPIGFIDPSNMQMKHFFGVPRQFDGLRLNGDDDIAGGAVHAADIIAVGTDLENANSFFTVVFSQYGSMYFFDASDRPVSYFVPNQGIYQGHTVGMPRQGGATLFTIFRENAIREGGGGLYRYDFGIGTGPFGPTVGITGNGTKEASAQKQTKLYSFKGEHTKVVLVNGGTALGFLERRDGASLGTWAVKLDAVTGAVLWEEKVSQDQADLRQNNVRIHQISTENNYIHRHHDEIWNIQFNQEKIDVSYISLRSPAYRESQGFQNLNAFFQYANDPDRLVDGVMVPLDGVGGWTIAMANLDSYTQKGVTPKDVLLDLGERVGIKEEQWDFSLLQEDLISGMVMQQPKPARAVAEDLQKVFLFDVAESDYKLKPVTRALSVSRVTVKQVQMGFIDTEGSSDNPSDWYKETRLQEIDLPQTVNLSYLDSKEDYQTGNQHARRPRSPMPVMQSRDKLDLNLPIAMTPDFAKQVANKILYSAWAERTTYEFALPWQFIQYDPTDLMTFEMEDGLTFQARMSQIDIGQDFSLRAAGVVTIPSTYISDAKGTRPGGIIPNILPAVPYSKPVILDVPYLSDADNLSDVGFGYYWGFKSYGPGFRYGSLENAANRGTFEGVGNTAWDTIWGTISGTLEPPSNGTWATDQTPLVLTPAFDFQEALDTYDFGSIPDDQWPDSYHTLIVGKEVIFFKDITFNANNTITITNMIRGARGTEHEIPNHRHGEEWFLVTPDAVQQDSESFQYTGQEFIFRPSLPGILPGMAPTERAALSGASHKPWSPVRLTRQTVGGAVNITWERRARIDGSLKPNTGTVPNDEGISEFEVYILPGAFDIDLFDPDNPQHYRRKYVVNTTSVTYALEDMGQDGFTLGSTLHVVVYQRNQRVGRGFPGAASLAAPL